MTTAYEHGGPEFGGGQPGAGLPPWVRYIYEFGARGKDEKARNNLRQAAFAGFKSQVINNTEENSWAVGDYLWEVLQANVAEPPFASIKGAWVLVKHLGPNIGPLLDDPFVGPRVKAKLVDVQEEFQEEVMQRRYESRVAETSPKGKATNRILNIIDVARQLRMGKFAYSIDKHLSDLIDVLREGKEEVERRISSGDPVSSETHEFLREWEGYEEGNMPYNRRTGQWYPARRYGRSAYNRGYRRYGRRYSGGYSPRRRRTYTRW